MENTKQETVIFNTAITILPPIGLGINMCLALKNPIYIVLLVICAMGTVISTKSVYESLMKLPEEEKG